MMSGDGIQTDDLLSRARAGDPRGRAGTAGSVPARPSRGTVPIASPGAGFSTVMTALPLASIHAPST